MQVEYLVAERQASKRIFRLFDINFLIGGEKLSPKRFKTIVGPRERLSKCLTCLIRVLLMMLDYCV